MSRVFQRRGAWVVDFADDRGQRVRKTLAGVTSKREAETLLAELVAQVRRRELGLEPAAHRTRKTVWELLDWWLKERCPPASEQNERWRLEKHVKGAELGAMLAVHVRAAHFEAFFSGLERPPAPAKPLSAGTINHLRAKMRTAFERARREDLFAGVNPLLETKLRKPVKRVYETVSAEEVPRVLAKVPPQWRGFSAAAVYLGLRKGEIAGLRKTDVDLKTMTLRVCRSYGRETTKGGHGDVLPVPDPMRPYLEAALKSRGSLLFGDAKGRMRTKEADPHLVLRRALKDAGLVIGFRLSCRPCKRDGKPYVDVVNQRPEPSPVCPKCGRQRLWVTPLPRPMRFHDLRHSMATILLRAGVDWHRVQRLIRHKSFELTSKTYSHLVVEDLRSAQRALVADETGTNPAPAAPPPQPPTKERAAK